VCTVTVVPVPGGFRLACNRDERRDRPPAHVPALHALARRRAAFPVDPVGGGTWIGVNEAGLAAALLNRSSDPAIPARRKAPRSRGLILPQVLECASLAEAIELTATLDACDFDRFRIVMAEHHGAAIVTSDGETLSVEAADLCRPMMLTSSSLGDALVDRPRRWLFERMFATDEGSWLSAQDRFHRHQWRSHPEISVRMERADARTVSHAVVQVVGRSIELRYRAIGSARSMTVAAA
jgi:hypothetical protein